MTTVRLCAKRCGSPALPALDLCLICSHGELAKRGRVKRKRRGSRKTFSVSAKAYAAFQAAAEQRNWSVSQLVEEALRDL